MEIYISDDLKNLSKEFDGKLYIVGGYVRNALLGLDCSDIDICAPFLVDEVKEKCDRIGYKCKVVNEKLGTLLITSSNDEKYEYTPFRKENYSFGKHSPDDVEFVEDIRIDAKRRDFTINSIYYNIEKGAIVDFYGGADDLKRGVVRCVETPLFVFSSDGLRILRMVRFACELGFKIDAKTFKTASEMVYQLRDISPERKYAEMKKIVLAEYKYNRAPNQFIVYFNGLRIYPYLFGFQNEKFMLNTKNPDYHAVLCAEHDAKFLTFLLFVMENKYEFSFMQESQVNCDVMLVSNHLRLPKNVSINLNKAYLTYQQLKFKPLNEFSAVNYHNLSDEQRKAVNVLCSPKEVSQMILGLKMRGVPLNISQLSVSAEEIGEIVPSEKISSVQKLLFEMCLKGVVKNEKSDLEKVLKSIKLK